MGTWEVQARRDTTGQGHWSVVKINSSSRRGLFEYEQWSRESSSEAYRHYDIRYNPPLGRFVHDPHGVGVHTVPLAEYMASLCALYLGTSREHINMLFAQPLVAQQADSSLMQLRLRVPEMLRCVSGPYWGAQAPFGPRLLSGPPQTRHALSQRSLCETAAFPKWHWGKRQTQK